METQASTRNMNSDVVLPCYLLHGFKSPVMMFSAAKDFAAGQATLAQEAVSWRGKLGKDTNLRRDTRSNCSNPVWSGSSSDLT